VRFQTTRSEGELSDILAELVRARLPVTQFRELHTDLEEAFLSFARPDPTPAAGRRDVTLAATGGA
jgi:ABC-2 type transport system ATP-binding protein